MKIIVSILLMFLSFQFSFAQQADKVIAQIRYQFIHIDDTTQRDNPYKEEMIMFLGKDASKYVSYDGILQQERLQKIMEEQLKSSPGNTSNINMGSVRKVNRDQYYYFANENKFFTLKRILSPYIIEEPAYHIDWNITNDTMNLKGIHCQKAITNFRGRNWIAWYAPELPFASGPWKLNGLPGLIIEAHDDKNEVKFEFDGIERIESNSSKEKEKRNGFDSRFPALASVDPHLDDAEIKLPGNAVKTTPQEFTKLQEAMKKDPQGFINTQMSGITGSDVKFKAPVVTRTDTKGAPAPKIKKLNNPIELTDQN